MSCTNHGCRSAERARDAALAEVTGLRDRLGRVEALAGVSRLVEATKDLDYSPAEGQWVCGDHGIPECTQGDCSDLPWPEPNGDSMLSAFTEWADGEFRRAVRPYDESDDPNREMPEEAFCSYSVWEWPVGALLEVAVPVTGDTEDASPAEAKCPTCGGARDDRRPAEGQALCPESFHFRTLASPSAKDAARPRRYDQCDETCTTDCGHCKGAASPTEQATEGGAK